MNKIISRRILVASVALFWGATLALHATDGVWINLAGGSWATPGNWQSGTAGGTDALANFATLNLAAARTVTLDGDRTVGHLRLSDTATTYYGWTLNAGTGGTLTLGVGSGVPDIGLTNAGSTINCTLAGSSGFKLYSLTAGLTLAGSNTLSGPVTIMAGALNLSTNNALQSGASLVVNNGCRLEVGSAGPAGIYGAGVPVTITGTGDGGRGAIRLARNNGGITWAGPVTLAGAAMIRAYGTGVPTYVFSGAIGGTGDLTLDFNSGYWTLLMTAQNRYAGNTTNSVSTAHNGALKMGTNDCLPPTTVLTQVAAAGKILDYDLNGFNQNLSGLIASGTGNNNVLNSSGTPATLTISNSADCAYAGTLGSGGGGFSLVKAGSAALTLSGAGTYSGGTVVSNGTLYVNNSAAGDATVYSGAKLAGSGNIAGSVNLNTGATIEAGTGAGVGILTTATLNLGAASTDMTTTRISANAGGYINGGVVTVTGTNVINIFGAAPAVGVYPLIAYSSLATNGVGGFQLGTRPFGVAASLLDTGTNLALNVTFSGGEPDVWVGNVLSQWNLAGNYDWKGAVTSTPRPYGDGDQVSFDDWATSFAVNVTANVAPFAIGVTNSSHDYTFSGTGGIVGAVGLVKDGSGTLVLANTNSYSGGTTIAAGTLQLGNGGSSGSIAGNVQNAGALVFNRADTVIFGGVISGAGSLEQRGPGQLTLSGVNTYGGCTMISGGVLVPATVLAMGDTNVALQVTNAGTLEVNTLSFGTRQVNVAGPGANGAGAIINSGTGQSSAFRSFDLTGDTTFGGNARWDIRDPSPASDPNGGTGAWLHGNGYSLTKVGTNYVGLIHVGDTGLGDIDIQAGTLTFSRSTTLGDATKYLAVYPGAVLNLHQTSTYVSNVLNKVVLMTNATVTVEANGQTNYLAGTMSLSGSNSVITPASTVLGLFSAVSGAGSLYKTGAGMLGLSGVCNYGGGTLMDQGTLQVEGLLGSGSSSVLVTNAVLSGNGTILDAVNIEAAATLSPGDGIGTLTLSNTLALAGTASMEVSKTDAGITNDLVTGMTTLTYRGTLTVVSRGTLAYAAGDSFKLFSAGSYTGGFTNITPAAPADSLTWDLSYLTVDGTLRVKSAVMPQPVITSSTYDGAGLILHGNNGTPNGGYSVLTSTNVALPLIDWTLTATGNFDGAGNFAYTNAVTTAIPQTFILLRVP